MPIRSALLVSLAALSLGGCVERKMFVRTDPDGALVTLNREALPAGTTPFEVSFDYYGTWDVVAEKEGYRPFRTTVPVPAPWYAYPVLDFITEILLPVTIRDHREVSLVLEPLPAGGAYDDAAYEAAKRRNDAVRQRAEEMRERVNAGDPAEVE